MNTTHVFQVMCNCRLPRVFWSAGTALAIPLRIPAGHVGRREKKNNQCGDFAMDILNDLFANIYSLINETLGHQAANAWNSLLWAIGFYTD